MRDEAEDKGASAAGSIGTRRGRDAEGVTDEVVLTLPRERAFYDVAHLVVGGLAIRLNLTFEHLEDLQVALDGLLPAAEDDGEVTVALRLDGDAVIARVGPFEAAKLKEELDAEGPDGPGLARVLSTVSDGFEVETDSSSSWVVLRKAVR